MSIAPPAPDVIELCREFVRIPSPSGQEGALAAVVAAHMKFMGFSVELDRFGSVLGTRKGTRPGPILLFDSHLDVVPVGDPEAWTHPPFGADLAEGRIWGRGAADTKCSLAALTLLAPSTSPPASVKRT